MSLPARQESTIQPCEWSSDIRYVVSKFDCRVHFFSRQYLHLVPVLQVSRVEDGCDKLKGDEGLVTVDDADGAEAIGSDIDAMMSAVKIPAQTRE